MEFYSGQDPKLIQDQFYLGNYFCDWQHQCFKSQLEFAVQNPILGKSQMQTGSGSCLGGKKKKIKGKSHIQTPSKLQNNRLTPKTDQAAAKVFNGCHPCPIPPAQAPLSTTCSSNLQKWAFQTSVSALLHTGWHLHTCFPPETKDTCAVFTIEKIITLPMV